MEILGIGIDIENVERFSGLTLEDHQVFLRRIFTERELEYCFSKANADAHLAVRFCGKKAVIKAHAGLRKELSHNHIEIINNENGSPVANLLCDSASDQRILLNLSHTQELATAIAIVIRDGSCKRSEN